jgi:hypothetical protein
VAADRAAGCTTATHGQCMGGVGQLRELRRRHRAGHVLERAVDRIGAGTQPPREFAVAGTRRHQSSSYVNAWILAPSAGGGAGGGGAHPPTGALDVGPGGAEIIFVRLLCRENLARTIGINFAEARQKRMDTRSALRMC